MPRLVSCLLSAAAAILLAGCAGYSLGPTQGRTARAQSIQVQPFINKTLEARLPDAVTTSLRRQLQQDGTFRLETHEDADIVIHGTIVSFDRRGLSFLPGDTRTVQDYRIVMTARVVATERATGRKVLDRDVTGQSTIRVGSDLASAERQGVPLVAEDLARHITGYLVDGAW